MRWALDQEYDDPANELAWDEGYCGTVIDGLEILWEVDICINNGQLAEDISKAFIDEAFCKRDYYGPEPDERFSAAWSRFKEVVTAKRRFTLWNSLEEGDSSTAAYGISAATMLPVVARNINQLSPVVAIPAGTRLWRVRIFDPGDPRIADPMEYTSPPNVHAKENRMSPKGISMFYGADDYDTAYKETVELDMKGK